jgi:hypothetical protein
LVAILESHEIEHRMALQNFSAGVEMTMANVVGNYLRWFELNRHRRELGRAQLRNRKPSAERTVDEFDWYKRGAHTPETQFQEKDMSGIAPAKDYVTIGDFSGTLAGGRGSDGSKRP